MKNVRNIKDLQFYEKVLLVQKWFDRNGTVFKIYNFKTDKEITKRKWEQVYPHFLVNDLGKGYKKLSERDYSVTIPRLNLVFYTDKINDMHDDIIKAIIEREANK